MSIQGKSIIITGGASGIGGACVRVLASRGAKLAIADLDAAKGQEAAAEAQRAGASAFFQQTDVTSRPQVQALVQRTLREHGGIDVLAHVAGNAFHKPFLEIDDELWQKTIAINLTGAFIINQEVARAMVAAKRGGRIINFASQVAATGGLRLPAYSAAKAGVVALSKTMQTELVRHNIVVSLVAPGATDTPLYRRDRSEEDLERMKRRIPFGRPASAEEVARVVAFLADDETAFLLAGQTLHTNGAQFMGF